MRKKRKNFSCNELFVMSFLFGAYTVFSLTRLIIQDESWGWIIGLILVYGYYLWFMARCPDTEKIDRIIQLMDVAEQEDAKAKES